MTPMLFRDVRLGDGNILLSHGKGRVSKHLLKRENIATAAQELHCKRMPEDMRAALHLYDSCILP